MNTKVRKLIPCNEMQHLTPDRGCLYVKRENMEEN